MPLWMKSKKKMEGLRKTTFYLLFYLFNCPSIFIRNKNPTICKTIHDTIQFINLNNLRYKFDFQNNGAEYLDGL